MIRCFFITVVLSLMSIYSFASKNGIDLYIWDSARLKEIKKEILQSIRQGSESASYHCYKDLITRCDRILTIENPTVINKPMTPPSGDKRDYMSLGRYWWPNPDTQDGLPYVRKDGVSNPELSKYDRGTLGRMAGYVNDLSMAYYISGSNKYGEKAVEMLKTWFLDSVKRMNPNMNYGQTIPGHNGGRGRAEGVIDTYSFVPMIDAMALLELGGVLKKETVGDIKRWFAEYVHWMVTSSIGIDERNALNNHSVAYDVQLVIFSLFSGNDSLAMKVVSEFAPQRIFKQVEPDGRQMKELARTTAMGYSTFNINHMIEMCHIARSMGVDLYNATSADGRCISNAVAYVVQFIGKDLSEFPYKQIKDWDVLQKTLKKLLVRAGAFDSRFASLASTYPVSGYDSIYDMLW